MKKIFKKIMVSSFVFFLPVLMFAQEGLLVPECDGVDTACTFGAFFRFVQDIIKFLIFYLSIPIAVLLIIYSGWLYLTTGIVDNKKKAKDILWAVLIGFAIMLSAYLIIQFILDFFLNPELNNIPNVI